MKQTFITSLCLLGLLAMFAPATHADETKDRMIQRKPAVDKLLQSGTVGEASTGYLAFVGSSRDGASTVEAENADRKIVYSQIAKQTGSTPEAVGQRRAKQIAQIAKPGTYLQDAAGNWRKK